MAPKGEDGSWLQERKGLDSMSTCFPRVCRKVYSDTGSSAPFARLDAHQQDVKARVLGALSCCCGGGSKRGSSSRWESDHDGCCKAPTSTYWKQLAKRAKAHVHTRQAAAPHPLNYDPHSYQMNFDDGGCRLEDRVSSFLIDENDDPASRERAMQSALLKKFAASRAQQVVA